jgi:hypothetical protein
MKAAAAIILLTASTASPAADTGLTRAEIDASITRGVDFLTGYQKPTGAWGGPTRTKGINIYAPLPGAHHAFLAGSTTLALCGMIDSQDTRPETEAAIHRGAEWVERELPKLRRADTTSTYNIWGHAYGLRALARLHRRETTAAGRGKWAAIARQQIDLAGRYEDVNGGWSYLDLFDDMATRRPSGITTSFTTATMLLGMAEARDAIGLELDPQTVRSSLDSIQRQRTPDFSYTYSHGHRMAPRGEINRPAGSLARSQACNAALRVFGDETVTDEVIIKWADRFLAREGWLDIGRKRPLPHETHFKISGYFYYYGIYYFTESVALLPAEKQAPYAARLAELIVNRQEQDGSWWDFPLYDYHQPYGTGYALMALAWCRGVLAHEAFAAP